MVPVVDTMVLHQLEMVVVLDDTDDFGQAMVLLKAESEPNMYLPDVLAHGTFVLHVLVDMTAFGKDVLVESVLDNE
jgi:hypothetical protein